MSFLQFRSSFPEADAGRREISRLSATTIRHIVLLSDPCGAVGPVAGGEWWEEANE